MSNYASSSHHPRNYLHVAGACGGMERLGGVPTLDLTPPGFGEEGLSGAAIDSLVSELLCKWLLQCNEIQMYNRKKCDNRQTPELH